MNIPSKMAAYVLMKHGDMDALEYHEDWPVPEINENEVLIKVGACGLNNTDVNTRTGWYSKSVTEETTGDAYQGVGEEDPSWGGAAIFFPRIQGADVAGEVVAVGKNAPQSLIGKRVIADCWLRDWNEPNNKDKTGYFGSECDGGFAEYTKIHFKNVSPVKSKLSDAELATFSCSYTTAEGMLNRANVSQNDRVLITGASGGVGSALMQLARRRGAYVIAMASEAKHDQVSKFEPDLVLPRSVENLAEILLAKTGHEKVNVVADIVGGDAFPQLIEHLERGGYYTCSGAIGGPITELDLRTLYLNDLTFTGSTVVPPEIFKNLVSYIEAEEIKPILAATYPLQELKAAQQAFIDKKHIGNIVVEVK